MLKKILFFVVFFYFLAIVQTSFLVHFNIKGYTPNFILFIVILINFFEKEKKRDGIIAAFIGGFFLSVFSNKLFGLEILILVLLAIFIKLVVKKYVRV